MGDRAFSMLCGDISVAGLAMLNGFLEVLDPFIHMRILPGRPRMLECLLSMLHQGVGMPLFTMCHGFLGMLQGFSCMFVCGKSKSAEERDTNKRGNRRNASNPLSASTISTSCNSSVSDSSEQRTKVRMLIESSTTRMRVMPPATAGGSHRVSQ